MAMLGRRSAPASTEDCLYYANQRVEAAQSGYFMYKPPLTFSVSPVI
jgi:hypothetical protein